jgi:hypothetical protein
MGQFKPMVKMMTTEPSIELKLKKGGKVSKMADGGFAPMQSAMPSSMPARGGMMPVASPGKPSMAARRKAMMVSKPAAPLASAMPPAMPPTMKKGGKAEGGKSDMAQDKAMIKKAMSQHDAQEHKGGKGTKLKLKTGGVTDGQGGYATGGIIKTEGQGGEYRNTKMDTAKLDRSPAKTGDVKDGNGGGFATGGVAKANGGGYKKGGAPKKYARGGSVVQDDGKAEKMQQGRKIPSPPVSITALSGTFKKGGSVKKFAEGGETKFAKKLADNSVDPKVITDKASRELEEALNPLSMAKEAYAKAKSYITGKKRGGSVKC